MSLVVYIYGPIDHFNMWFAIKNFPFYALFFIRLSIFNCLSCIKQEGKNTIVSCVNSAAVDCIEKHWL